MPVAMKYADLIGKSPEALIEEYDRTATTGTVGLEFLRQEIAIRASQTQTAKIVEMTKCMRDLTGVIAALTVVIVLLTAVLLWKAI